MDWEFRQSPRLDLQRIRARSLSLLKRKIARPASAKDIGCTTHDVSKQASSNHCQRRQPRTGLKRENAHLPHDRVLATI